MIQNFAAYNTHKRGTLDRLSTKYRVLFMNVFEAHLRSMRPLIVSALDNNASNFPVDLSGLDKQLHRVLEAHMLHTVKTGVSDGWREVSPDNQLNQWAVIPFAIPIENTFTVLAERKKRDSFIEDALKKIREKYSGGFAEIISLEKERYLKNVRSVYRTIADDYFKNPDSDYTDDVAKEVLKRVFGKTQIEAERIFRTETTAYFNDARLAYFKDGTSVDFVSLFAITDGRISTICESRANYVIPIGRAGERAFKPPFHPNCRTIQSPLMSYLKSDAAFITANLGSEFGTVTTTKKQKGELIEVDFVGRRAPPEVPLPRGWAS